MTSIVHAGRRTSLDERVVGSLLLARAERLGDQPFVSVGDSAPIAYGELAERARAAAGGFRELGVARGTHVAIMLPNCEEYLVAWLGLALLGAVEVPVNTALKGSLLRHVLGDSRAEIALVSAELAPELERAGDGLPYLRRTVVLGGARAPGTSSRTVRPRTPRTCAPPTRSR